VNGKADPACRAGPTRQVAKVLCHSTTRNSIAFYPAEAQRPPSNGANSPLLALRLCGNNRPFCCVCNDTIPLPHKFNRTFGDLLRQDLAEGRMMATFRYQLVFSYGTVESSLLNWVLVLCQR
jgi:hypothetical protein